MRDQTIRRVTGALGLACWAHPGELCLLCIVVYRPSASARPWLGRSADHDGELPAPRGVTEGGPQ